MTLEESTLVIYDEAKIQGEPLTMDVCRQIAKRLLGQRQPVDLRPGAVAQYHRERYDENL